MLTTSSGNESGYAMEHSSDQDKSLSFWQVIKSTLAAMFGVQSKKNLGQDFQHGKPIHYIVAGIIFATLFLLTVIGLVKLFLGQAGIH